MTNRRWLTGVAFAALVGLAAYGMLTALTLSPGDRSIFGLEALDARPLYVLVAVLGLLVIPFDKVRPWWLVLMSFTTMGRSASLVVLGSPDLTRAAELRGGLGWLLLWMLGLLAVLVIEAAATLRGVLGGT